MAEGMAVGCLAVAGLRMKVGCWVLGVDLASPTCLSLCQ